MSLAELGAFLGVLIGGLGMRELVAGGVKRRQDRADARERARVTAAELITANSAALGQINAEDKSQLLQELLDELRERITGYRADIERLTARHDEELHRQGRLIEALQDDNRRLTGRVERLQQDVQEYRLGAKVPRGMVLVPLAIVRAIRSTSPALLPSPWYVGEEEDSGQRSIVAEITPLGPIHDRGHDR